MKLTSPKFDERELQLLKQCLDSGWVTQGPFTKKFEDLFSERHRVKYALATTSCTAALHLSALALGLGPVDEVIVPAFTWITSANCAEYVGAKTVFADIDCATYNLDPGACERAISPRTKAIVVVHLFGMAAKMEEIMSLARRHNLYVIEDAACAVGTTYDDEPVGGMGNVGCFSFHPRKVITTGEGGMITTNDPEISDRVQSLRNHGATGLPAEFAGVNHPYMMTTFNNLGYNLRLSDIQGSVGVAQMEKLDDLLRERKRLAGNYHLLLNDIEEIALPLTQGRCGHTYQSYVIRVLRGGNEKRNQIMDHLFESGIETRPGTHAVHRLGYYRNKYHLAPEMFPNACLGEDTTITLPLFPGMTENDQTFVVSKLKDAFKMRGR